MIKPRCSILIVLSLSSSMSVASENTAPETGYQELGGPRTPPPSPPPMLSVSPEESSEGCLITLKSLFFQEVKGTKKEPLLAETREAEASPKGADQSSAPFWALAQGCSIS